MVMGLANGHFFPEFGELLFWGPAMPCGDMHHSVTDAYAKDLIDSSATTVTAVRVSHK